MKQVITPFWENCQLGPFCRGGAAIARINFGGCGTPKKVDFLNLTPLTLQQKPHFWPILWLKVDFLADLGGCVAPPAFPPPPPPPPTTCLNCGTSGVTRVGQCRACAPAGSTYGGCQIDIKPKKYWTNHFPLLDSVLSNIHKNSTAMHKSRKKPLKAFHLF